MERLPNHRLPSVERSTAYREPNATFQVGQAIVFTTLTSNEGNLTALEAAPNGDFLIYDFKLAGTGNGRAAAGCQCLLPAW